MAAYPAYVPDFKLTINDSEMPAALKSSVMSVRYQDGINAADRVEVGFAMAGEVEVDGRAHARILRGDSAAAAGFT